VTLRQVHFVLLHEVNILSVSFETKERSKTKIDFLNNSSIDSNDSCETRKARVLKLMSLSRLCWYSLHNYVRGGSIV